MPVWEEIKERIEKDDEFSTLPHIAARVMKMVDDPDTTAAELEKFISLDQVLTAEVLKLANSPLYAPRTPIVSLRHAISYLGMANIRSLALMVSIRSLYTKGRDREIMNSFWKHAAASAIVLKNITLALKDLQLNSEEMFTLGLLHDFGKVVLFKYFPEKYKTIVSQVVAGETDFVTAERKLLGISHAEVGAMVLSKWDLPIDIVNAVGMHHQEPTNEMLALIQLGNIFSASWGYSMVDPKFETQNFEKALEIVKIDENRWGEITEKIKDQIQQSEEVLNP